MSRSSWSPSQLSDRSTVVDTRSFWIFLPLGGLTDEEILLRRRERASEYAFDIRAGFSYQFGSIFNNVVNNRF